MVKPFVFISYRRDDSAGHAGRLEEALERACGEGSVFRDVRDIGAGEPFADVLKAALASARVVIVLIGPRWAGTTAEGGRRIDLESDVVRLEVVTALHSGCKVVPVLPSGTGRPRGEDLPVAMQPLLRRQALFLNEESWNADVDRLVKALGVRSSHRGRIAVALGGLALLVAGAATVYLQRQAHPGSGVDAPPANADSLAQQAGAAALARELLGTWQGHVRYGWGDEYDETFQFEQFAGEVTGTATFLAYPRAIEELQVSSGHLSFVTHSAQSMGEEERQLTHRYTAQWQDADLRVRMHTTGGFDSYPPYEFTIRRALQRTNGRQDSAVEPSR